MSFWQEAGPWAGALAGYVGREVLGWVRLRGVRQHDLAKIQLEQRELRAARLQSQRLDAYIRYLSAIDEFTDALDRAMSVMAVGGLEKLRLEENRGLTTELDVALTELEATLRLVEMLGEREVRDLARDVRHAVEAIPFRHHVSDSGAVLFEALQADEAERDAIHLKKQQPGDAMSSEVTGMPGSSGEKPGT